MTFDVVEKLTDSTLYFVYGILGILISATIIMVAMVFANPKKNFDELVLRIKTWWIIFGVFGAAVSFGNTGVIVLFALVSYLSLKEYFSLIPTRKVDRKTLFWVYLAIPIHYYWISIQWYGLFVIFIPVFCFLLLPTRVILKQEPSGFLTAISTIQWGLMLTVFCISHVAYLFMLPPEYNPNGMQIGLLVYLVFLSQFNDVAQYVFGKSFGKKKIIPKISPGKTYAGLLGGIFTTTVLSYFVGPLVTPMNSYYSVLGGVIISLGGFTGDIIESGIKRDLGVKDSGSLLPGHGGILDRIDGLSYSAPLFFHYIYFLYYP